MKDRLVGEQAGQLANMLPRLLRAIFTLDANDPTMELPVAQLRACNILGDGPRTVSVLARELGITVSATTQVADRLESAGLVERLAGTQDRRTRTLRLTDDGAEVLRARREQRVRRAREVLEQLTPEMRFGALKALHALLEAGTATAPRLPANENGAPDGASPDVDAVHLDRYAEPAGG